MRTRVSQGLVGLLLTGIAAARSTAALPPPTPCPSCWVPSLFTSWQIQFTMVDPDSARVQ